MDQIRWKQMTDRQQRIFISRAAISKQQQHIQELLIHISLAKLQIEEDEKILTDMIREEEEEAERETS